MSKYVKNLIADVIKSELAEVNDALLVNMIGIGVNANNMLRDRLAEKGIHVMVVKNSLAQRACEGTPLDGLFTGVTGSNAVCWGCEDIVSLAKTVMELSKDEQFKPFGPTGGMMDGDQLTVDQVKDVSKWPTRDEQISMVVGQIVGVGSGISSQLIAPGSKLASQFEKMSEGAEDVAEEAPADEAAAAAPADTEATPEAEA